MVSSEVERGSIHRSTQALENAIKQYLASYNQDTRPFGWAKTAGTLWRQLPGIICGLISRDSGFPYDMKVLELSDEGRKGAGCMMDARRNSGEGLKRAMDVFLAAVALLILSPVWLFVASCTHNRLGSPVLFRQMRPGLHGQPFEMIKFRTMRDAVNEQGHLLPDAERLTSYGRFLRSTSLDELPGLWNVLKGDMSLVGPRPLLMEYVPLYSPAQARRHNVRPGITGWAQVNGRNAISWEEKFALDVWYVDHRTFWLDLRILCRTVRKVLVREDINSEGQATMSKFTGGQ